MFNEIALLSSPVYINSFTEDCLDNVRDKKSIEIEIDFTQLIPEELIVKIFSYFDLETLGRICLVNKKWKQLAIDPNLWKNVVYREIAFGSDKWAQFFGDHTVENENIKEEISSLPIEMIIKDFQNIQKIFPNKHPRDCLQLFRIPKTLNGEISLKCLGLLFKNKINCNADLGYRYISSGILKDFADFSIKKSYWILMTKYLVPESTNKTVIEQKNDIASLTEKGLNNYDLPYILEAVTCILIEYFKSETRLFSEDYLFCNEKVKSQHVSVGEFSVSGLLINELWKDKHSEVGASIVKRFEND